MQDARTEWFEKAYAEHYIHAWVLSDPRLDPLRSDLRFKSLMRRMELPQ